MNIFNNNNIIEDAIFTYKVKWVLLQGDNGIRALRGFYACDAVAQKEGRIGLSFDEFGAFLSSCGVKLSSFELQYLCKAFDDSKTGAITATTFIRHLTGMNYRRTKVVEQIWEYWTKDQQGKLQRRDLAEAFHRMQEKRSAQEAQATRSSAELDAVTEIFYKAFSGTIGTTLPRHDREAHATYSVAHGVSGTSLVSASSAKIDASESDGLTKEEFVVLCSGVSQRVAIDEVFEVALLRDWEADNRCKPILNETEREWGENGDPLARQGPRYVRDALDMSLGISRKSYNFSHMQRTHPYVEPLPYLDRQDLMRSICEINYRPYMRDEYASADPLVTRRGKPT